MISETITIARAELSALRSLPTLRGSTRFGQTVISITNPVGGYSTQGHPPPWAGRAPAEAELPHIDPRRGVLSTELGLMRRGLQVGQKLSRRPIGRGLR